MRAWIPTLLLIALAAAGCGTSDWERRAVSSEQAEAELTRLLDDAEPAAHVAEIEIGERDIWAVTADAVLTVHPDCASMTVGGRSSYRRAGMGVVKGLGIGSPLPVDVSRFSHRDQYGAPSRAQIGERRIVLLWLRPGAPHDVAAIAMEFVPESDGSADGPEVEWRRTAQIRVTYCYDAAGSELSNFDRSALPPLDLAGLDGHSALHAVWLRIRPHNEFPCSADRTSNIDPTGFDENAPEYSGVAPGSDPTPAILQALRDALEEPDDFELWYVDTRRAVFASLADREQGGDLLGQVVEVQWLGFDADGAPAWVVDYAGSIFECPPDWPD